MCHFPPNSCFLSLPLETGFSKFKKVTFLNYRMFLTRLGNILDTHEKKNGLEFKDSARKTGDAYQSGAPVKRFQDSKPLFYFVFA